MDPENKVYLPKDSRVINEFLLYMFLNMYSEGTCLGCNSKAVLNAVVKNGADKLVCTRCPKTKKDDHVGKGIPKWCPKKSKEGENNSENKTGCGDIGCSAWEL